MTETEFIKQLGGRKFFLVLFVFWTAVLLLLTDKIGNGAFLDIAQLLLTAYLVGNVTQGFIKQAPVIINTELEQTETLGRKFQFICMVYAAGVGLVYFKYIDITSYVNLTYWLVSLYVAGNVVEKAVGQINVSLNKPSA